MDKEKAKALYEKLPLKLRFSNYYKYSFSFTGENEAIKAVGVSFGGNADDIYRQSVDNEAFDAPQTFEELLENYNYVTFEDAETGEKFAYNDF